MYTYAKICKMSKISERVAHQDVQFRYMHQTTSYMCETPCSSVSTPHYVQHSNPSLTLSHKSVHSMGNATPFLSDSDPSVVTYCEISSRPPPRTRKPNLTNILVPHGPSNSIINCILYLCSLSIICKFIL
uniref:Uncharacterized protein n=1 Tax=Cacopsylla melanoneura TaxID=428564 RepID=A0A8D8WCT4_9HEMI